MLYTCIKNTHTHTQRGGAFNVKKSSSTKCKPKRRTWEGWLRKKRNMKLYFCSSQALIRWQILFWMTAILQRKEKNRGRKMKKGSCTLLYGDHRRKSQSSVTCLEYLRHRKAFFPPSNLYGFSEFYKPWSFWKRPCWTLSQLCRIKQKISVCPFDSNFFYEDDCERMKGNTS